MKKYFILLSAAVVCQFCAARPAGAQSLETGYESLRSSLLEIKSGTADLPRVERDIVETLEQTIWPLPPYFQWYWHAQNGGLSLAQAEAAAAELKSGGIHIPIVNYTAKLLAVHIEKKSKKPTKLTFDHVVISGQATGVAIPIDNSPYGAITSLGVYYASAQGADTKWLVWVYFGINSEFRMYFKTEAEARKFVDVIASCLKLAGLPAAPQSRTGLRVSDLSSTQADVLGKTRIDNALVTWLAADGPGEKAGAAFLDLITAVDGVNVRNADHFNTMVEAAAPGAVLKLSCLERTTVVEGDKRKFVWMPKTVDLPVK